MNILDFIFRRPSKHDLELAECRKIRDEATKKFQETLAELVRNITQNAEDQAKKENSKCLP